MESVKNDKMIDCVRTHRRVVFGLILVIIATVLTLFTLSSLGILGMFIVGSMFCVGHCFQRGCCCCGSSMCDASQEHGSCSTSTSEVGFVPAKTKIKKTVAKKAK